MSPQTPSPSLLQTPQSSDAPILLPPTLPYNKPLTATKQTNMSPVPSSLAPSSQQPPPPPTILTSISSTASPLSHLSILIPTIRSQLSTLIANTHNLTVLAPDANVHNLHRRLDILSQITLSHCEITQNLIIPSIQAAALSSQPSNENKSHSDPLERPTKRRRSSPVYVELAPLLPRSRGDYDDLNTAFDNLRAVLAQLDRAPISPGGGPGESRKNVLTRLRMKAMDMAENLTRHLDKFDSFVLRMGVEVLHGMSPGHVVVKAVLAFIQVDALKDAFRNVQIDVLGGLFETLVEFAAVEELRRCTTAVAGVVSVDQWETVCKRVPSLIGLVTPKHNPLIEIVHLHKAIGQELKDIVDYCQGIVVTDLKQLQSLSARMKFLRRVHTCHSDGEDNVLLRELNIRLASSPCAVEAHQFHEEHGDENALFDNFERKLEYMQEEVRSQAWMTGMNPLSRKEELVSLVKCISEHIIGHMKGEEVQMFPLVRKHFSLADQDRIMRQVMNKVPSDFLHELIPWMFGFLLVDEQESLLRNLLRTAPQDEFGKAIGSIAQSVRKGMTDRMQWNELCLRVPEVEVEYKSIAETDQTVEMGPVSEILRVHKAFRIELQDLMRRAKQIPADGSIPNPKTLSSLAESVAFLQKMVADHSKSEDDILLPLLEKRVPGISAKYKNDHCDERTLFNDLAKILEELRCVGDEVPCGPLVQRLHNLSRTLRDEMILHLDLEEKHMWPHVTTHFTPEEQTKIVALIFGQMPGSRLRELLPWMIRMLSVSERNTMMNHILEVTKSTMFETWLKTWLPLDEEMDKRNRTAVTSDKASSAEAAADSGHVRGANRRSESMDASRSATALLLLHGRENIERTMRSIARDESLSAKDRAMMMQQVMLAPYNERANQVAAHGSNHHDKDDRAATYAKGTQLLGCDHYVRSCKIRAACCGHLYTCRLCHDAAETHIMERCATTEIFCMRCDTLQPVSKTCINEACNQQFARYFCKVCVFYDDKNRNIYHCHSCNVCRGGKGLGQDYFHCMKCNQCMSLRYQHDHICVENSMESDCPVCFQYMFTTTSPVKYLKCGHLMHTNCFKQYRQRNIRCPICSKSLQETAPLYQAIDQVMLTRPWGYASAKCDLFCNDCSTKSSTALHVIFNKCPSCSSYNTRVDRIVPNVQGSHD